MGGRSVAIALPVLQGRVTRRQLQGGRFNRPNDVICHSNGCLYFTDPEKRRPYQERQIPGPAGEDNLWDGARVYRLAPDGGLSVLANSRARAVAGRAYNVRREHALLAIYPRDRLDAAGNMVGRSIFADLNEGSEPGITDGLKVDSIRRVYYTGRAASGSSHRRTGASASSGGRSRPSTSRSVGRTCGRCFVARTPPSTRCASRFPAFASLVQATRAVISQRDQWRCPKPIGRGAEHWLRRAHGLPRQRPACLSVNRHGSDEVFGKYFCSAITVVLHWRVPPIRTIGEKG